MQSLPEQSVINGRKFLNNNKKIVKTKGAPLVFSICKFYNNIIRIYRQREINCLNFTKYSP